LTGDRPGEKEVSIGPPSVDEKKTMQVSRKGSKKKRMSDGQEVMSICAAQQKKKKQ